MTTRLVGVLELASKYRYGLTSHGTPLYLFRPYDEKSPDFVVGSNERDLSKNQIAVVDVPGRIITDGVQKPRGSLVRLIGPVGERDAETAALLQHYCPTTHPRTAAAATGSDTADSRIELSHATGWITFHVDPPGCRDIDDAIAYHPETGRMAITIADVASTIQMGSALDRIAKEIGTSFYDLEGRVVRPMLPPALSEDALSLLPGQRRRGVSYIFGPNGIREWALSWITVAHSFTYEAFAVSDIATMVALSKEKDPHDWIADMMILYNGRAAALLKKHGIGLLRTQAATAAAQPGDKWPPALKHLANEAALYEPVSAENQGHAGLGLSAYAHASSPLRRYADLVNQRILTALITNREFVMHDIIDTTAIHLNARTKAAKRWTRDLTFLAHVSPGKVHEIAVLWISEKQVWVPAWNMILKLRHSVPEPPVPGTEDRIQIFCDPTRRNWKRRILTATAAAPAATPVTA
jgi:exoribonuclease R